MHSQCRALGLAAGCLGWAVGMQQWCMQQQPVNPTPCLKASSPSPRGCSPPGRPAKVECTGCMSMQGTTEASASRLPLSPQTSQYWHLCKQQLGMSHEAAVDTHPRWALVCLCQHMAISTSTSHARWCSDVAPAAAWKRQALILAAIPMEVHIPMTLLVGRGCPKPSGLALSQDAGCIGTAVGILQCRSLEA